MRNVWRRSMTVYAGLVFILTMLLVLFPIWLSGVVQEPRRTRITIWLCRRWMDVFFVLVGIRLDIKGRENFSKGENYIIVSNHNSLMDVPVSSPGIPGANKTIAKVEMSRIPLFGIIYKRGSVLVDRKNDQSRRDSYLKMREVLDKGMHMCIYPEGTRNKTGRPLKDFHDGAFRLASDTGKSIIPAVIFGTARMLPNESPHHFSPGRLGLHFLEPVSVQKGEDVGTLKNKVFNLMWTYYEEHMHDYQLE